jgi:hypothetical protein
VQSKAQPDHEQGLPKRPGLRRMAPRFLHQTNGAHNISTDYRLVHDCIFSSDDGCDNLLYR